MAHAPPRPDTESGSPFAAEPKRGRPTAAFGLAAALIWIVGGYAAYREIGWYPPPTAFAILAAGAPIAFGLGILAARVDNPGLRSVLGVTVMIASLLGPRALTTSMPGVAHPEEVPLPGRPTIALGASPEDNAELWLMRGDADHVTRLTDTPAREVDAQLSPDGTEIVFATDASGTWDLSVMTLTEDGSPRPIRSLTTRADADETGPEWSPDGMQIAFTVGLTDHNEVWIVNADGSDAHRIIEAGDSPSWSPDGTQIAFGARSEDDPSDWDIWVAEADGSDPRTVIDVGVDFWPHWSPDGASLLFTSDAAGDREAWSCPLPCTAPRNLTNDPDADEESGQGWTPDGHPIVASNRLHYGGVFVYFVDDQGQMRLSLII